MKTKRILSAFFALLLCLMPTTALAADGGDTTYPLWVGGVQVTSANQGDILKDGGTAKFEVKDGENILTLTNATITATSTIKHSGGVTYNDVVYARGLALTVSLAGDNTLGNSSADNAIHSDEGSLTITGGGSLTAASLSECALWANDGISITGSTVTATDCGTDGIFSRNGVTITDSTVTASGSRYGIGGFFVGSPLTVSGNSVFTAEGGSRAISARYSVTLNDGLVYTEGSADAKKAVIAKPAPVAKVTVSYYDPTDKTNPTKTAECIPVTAGSNSWTDGGWYAVTEDVTISDRIEVSGTVNLILCDGAALTATQGVHLKEGNTLIIWNEKKDGTGALKADNNVGTTADACIGGNGSENGGSVTVYGGEVTANGTHGAGIGGGRYGDGGTVTVYGGEVTANNDYGGAGIGGGYGGNGGTVTVYGGRVMAKGNIVAAGIGGGCIYQGSGGNGGVVNIYGGTVEAYCGRDAKAIGVGDGGSSDGPLTIYDAAKVTAGDRAASAKLVSAADRVSACQSNWYAKIEPCTEHEYENGACKWCGAKTVVKISKTDIADGAELEGATLQIIDSEGNLVDVWVSEKEAHTIEGLTTGEEYTLRETVAPDGYTVATDTTFSLDETGKVTTTGTVTEDGLLLVEDAKTKVKVSKVDVATGEEVEGAHIQIIETDYEGNVTVRAEWDSGKEAHTVEGLKTGVEYTLRETVAPDGYTVATDTTFTIDETGKVTTTGTVTEDGVILIEDAKTVVKISKTDIADGAELEGATIQIIDSNGNVVDEWTSGTDAHTVEGLKTGVEYTLRETVAPEGYTVATDTKFTIDETGKVTSTGTVTEDGVLLVEDAKTKVKVSKVDIGTGEEVEGATLQIIDSDGKVVDEWVSTKEAHVTEGLKTGEEYTLRETVAPEGYTVATDTKFTIDETGKVTTIGTITEDGVMLVENAKTVVKISKTDIADGAELEGATLQILDPDGKVVEEWVSTKEAHETEGLKTGVEYTLRETVAPDGYTVTTDTTFTIDETGKVTTTGTITEDGVMLVENEKAFTITAKADPESAGTVTGAGTYKKDEKVTLKASAGVGYAFVNWTENGSEVSSAAEYTFNAEADRDLTANFRLLEYKVTWIDGDGNVLKTEQVKYGVMPVYTGDAPTKTADAQYSYTFNGKWSPEIVSVTEAAEYTAQFDKTVNKYTVTWLNDDDSVIDTTTVEYGTVPTHADPTKAATAEYTYTFAGWDPVPAPVTGKATYKATYTAEKNVYTVTWVIDGKEEKENYEYGAAPTHADPTRPATAQYTYTFKGWTPAVEKVTGDATYTAVFDAAVNHYTVTWVIDGRAQTEDYAYGEMPWHVTPAKSGALGLMYVFKGWSPTIVPVTGNAVYTAIFEAQRNPLFPGPKTPTGEKPPVPSGEPTPPPTVPVTDPPAFPFTDVVPADSFYDDVRYVYDHDIMNGISASLFDPFGTLTRGMVVTILYRIEGSPDVEYKGTFTDVPDGTWYTDGVEWAASKGIVNGYGNGKFGPTDEVTREQLAAILYRYAGFKGYDVSIDENTNFLSYNDVFDIAGYAKLPMFWAIENDMILDTKGDLRPAEAALRWEVAAAIRAFRENAVK